MCERNSFPTTFENYADVSINKIQNSVGKVVSTFSKKISTETDNNDLQNMLNDQLYKFYNLDFRILMTSHENDLYIYSNRLLEYVK